MSLTKDCFLPPLVQLSGPASLVASIGFYWDEEKGMFVKMSRAGLRRHRVTSYIHAVSVASMLFQTIVSWEPDRSKLLISSFGLIVLTFTLITVWVYHLKLNRAVYVINNLIQISRDLAVAHEAEAGPSSTANKKAERGLDGREKFIKFMAPLFHWSAMSVPFVFVGGVVWSMPCLNSSFGWQVLPECHTTKEAPPLNLTFILFILTNIVLWSYSIQCAVFVAIGVEMLGAMSIRSFLKSYKTAMLSISVISSQVASVSQARLFRVGLIYRRIQLICEALNDVHSTWVLIPLLFTVSSHQVFSMYGAIKFNGKLNFLCYCLFAILASQGVLVIMGMYTALGDVHKMSVSVKSDLTKAHRRHRWLRRWHLGCSLVKIRFGTINYVDSSTPLMFENFALSQTANMLLVD